MKRVLSATLFVALALAFSFTFAATVVPEPSLPSDIGSWKKVTELMCTRQGQTIVNQEYHSGEKWLIVITKNGQKLLQASNDEEGIAPNIVTYVKHSSEGNWLKYGGGESNEANRHADAALGLTKREFTSCTLGK